MALTLTVKPVSQELVERAREAAARLRRDPYFGRLIRGEVDEDEYAAWLVQMHKYIRHTVRTLKGHAEAMAARAYRDRSQAPLCASSTQHSKEEDGHDDSIVQDLAALWRCGEDEARGRIEREPSAPAVVDWERLSDVMLARFPIGMIGVGLALETISSLVSDDILRGLLAARRIPGIEDAVRFVREHSGEAEEDHTRSACARADSLACPTDRAAVFFYGTSALAMFESLVRYLNERLAVRKPEPSAAA